MVLDHLLLDVLNLSISFPQYRELEYHYSSSQTQNQGNSNSPQTKQEAFHKEHS